MFYNGTCFISRRAFLFFIYNDSYELCTVTDEPQIKCKQHFWPSIYYIYVPFDVFILSFTYFSTCFPVFSTISKYTLNYILFVIFRPRTVNRKSMRNSDYTRVYFYPLSSFVHSFYNAFVFKPL